MPDWVLSLIFVAAGGMVVSVAVWWEGRRQRNSVSSILRKHFGTADAHEIMTRELAFPLRLRVAAQKAVEDVLQKETEVVSLHGVESANEAYFHYFQWLQLGDLFLVSKGKEGVRMAPPQFEMISLGDDEQVRVLRNGLWLFRKNNQPLALLMVPSYFRRPAAGLAVQIACRRSPEAEKVLEDLVRRIEEAFRWSGCYRGKVLSLEMTAEEFAGEMGYVKVHSVPRVSREEVILPESVLTTIERNVLHFARHREQLKSSGLHLKKGLLFYGPPGTGKTHTLRYLIGALPEHTVFLIRAEQVNFLSEYMVLARMLQPSLVIIEDVDLIAPSRTPEGSNHPLLNRLLDEMDGIEEDAEVIFILTTNRPLSLEEALAGRPGRIDQAIEFPLPDLGCRRRLLRLYGKGIHISESLCEAIARSTEGTSAAFIKELMRRARQMQLERSDSGELSWQDVQNALEEMTVRGGKLNLKLLGAEPFGFQ